MRRGGRGREEERGKWREGGKEEGQREEGGKEEGGRREEEMTINTSMSEGLMCESVRASVSAAF